MKNNIKYKLTWWQNIELIFIWLLWSATPEEERKTWHEVKNGMERHTHNFVKHHRELGHDWLKCDHEGCNMLEPVESEEEKARAKRINDYMAKRSH